MDKKTLEATKESFEIWSKQYNERDFVGYTNCPLCKLHNKTDGCDGCPIYKKTGVHKCRGTTFYDEKSEERTLKMVQLLASLLEPEESFMPFKLEIDVSSFEEARGLHLIFNCSQIIDAKNVEFPDDFSEKIRRGIEEKLGADGGFNYTEELYNKHGGYGWGEFFNSLVKDFEYHYNKKGEK